MGYQIEGTFPMESQTLTSWDGAFMCAPEVGAEAAYLLSTIDDCYIRAKDPMGELNELQYLLRDYFRGNLTVVDVIKELQGEEWQSTLYTNEEMFARMKKQDKDRDDEV